MISQNVQKLYRPYINRLQTHTHTLICEWYQVVVWSLAEKAEKATAEGEGERKSNFTPAEKLEMEETHWKQWNKNWVCCAKAKIAYFKETGETVVSVPRIMSRASIQPHVQCITARTRIYTYSFENMELLSFLSLFACSFFRSCCWRFSFLLICGFGLLFFSFILSFVR